LNLFQPPKSPHFPFFSKRSIDKNRSTASGSRSHPGRTLIGSPHSLRGGLHPGPDRGKPGRVHPERDLSLQGQTIKSPRVSRISLVSLSIISMPVAPGLHRIAPEAQLP